MHHILQYFIEQVANCLYKKSYWHLELIFE